MKGLSCLRWQRIKPIPEMFFKFLKHFCAWWFPLRRIFEQDDLHNNLVGDERFELPALAV